MLGAGAMERDRKRRAKSVGGHAQDARTDFIRPLASCGLTPLSSPLHLRTAIANSLSHGQSDHQVRRACLRGRQQQTRLLLVRVWSGQVSILACVPRSESRIDNLQVQWGSQDHYEIVRKVGRGKYSEVRDLTTMKRSAQLIKGRLVRSSRASTSSMRRSASSRF